MPGDHAAFFFMQFRDWIDRMVETIETGTIEENYTSSAVFFNISPFDALLEAATNLFGIYFDYITSK